LLLDIGVKGKCITPCYMAEPPFDPGKCRNIAASGRLRQIYGSDLCLKESPFLK
jgi:hypothetical protein